MMKWKDLQFMLHGKGLRDEYRRCPRSCLSLACGADPNLALRQTGWTYGAFWMEPSSSVQNLLQSASAASCLE